MVAALPVRWLLTTIFAAAGLAWLPVRGRAGTARAADRISAVFHALMCAALTAMTWRSAPALPPWLQAALFGCAAIWFGLASPGRAGRFRAGRFRAGRFRAGRFRAGRFRAGRFRAGRFRARSLSGLHHALMAGAMIWMVTAMPAAMPMAPAAAARSAMPAMPRPATPVAPLVSVLLAAYFTLAALPWLVRAIGRSRRGSGRAAASHAAMSAGMAAMLLTMI